MPAFTSARTPLRACWGAASLALGLGLSLATLGACDKKKDAGKAPAKAPAQVAKPKADPAQPAKPAEKPAPKLDVPASQAKFASTLFGFATQKADAKQNFVISPMSVYMALGMTRLGAKAATAKAMDTTLALPDGASSEQLASALGAAQRSWTQERDGSRLALANRLFADESFKIQPSFVEMTKTSLGAGIQNLAFQREADAARKTINDWVAGQTKQRIKDLLSPGEVSANTRLVLVNAIWFKGDWAHPFKKAKTKRRRFTLAGGRKIKVPTMAQILNLPVFEAKSQGFVAIDLPYGDGRLAMSVILPDEKQSAADLAAQVNLHEVSQALNKANPRRVSLQLPKFKVDPSKSMSLRPILEQMGAKTMFGDPKPDFSGLAQASEQVSIQDVVHKAMIIVDEKGAEGAAATAVALYRSAVPNTMQFNANRPFLFMIRDKKDGAILFAGRIMKPVS